MALVDIIDDWGNFTGTHQQGSFTYQDSTEIGYQYGMYDGRLTADPGMGSGAATTVSGLGQMADLRNDENLMYIRFHDPADTSIPVETAGVSLAMSDWGDDMPTGGAAQIYVNAQIINLNEWIDLGYVTITGDGATGNGENLVDPEGRYAGPGSEQTAFINFHVAIEAVSVVRDTATYFADLGGTYAGVDIVIDDAVSSAPAPCFTAGTLIDTDQGPVAVETLQVGDMIKTKDHGFQPVKWAGGSRVMDAPVRIAKGTFGNVRDLVVSPRHRMLLQGWQMGLLFNHDEAFATAYDLKNGTTIRQEPEGWVEYYHVLLDRHEVIYAEGVETESFFPDEASLNGIAKNTREELAAAIDLSTFGRTVRPTLTANQAMYLSHNMDLLEDTPNQIAAQ